MPSGSATNLGGWIVNENCLEGYCCPECKHEGPFTIGIKGHVEVEDDGFDHGEIENVRWGDNSYCECSGCGHSGIVSDFTGSRTKGKVSQSICPECKSEETSRLELVFGNAGVMQDEKGGWDYDGNGTEVDWNSQFFTGIWICDKCNHEWGEFNQNALNKKLGQWAPKKSRNLMGEVLRHSLKTKNIHPIDAIVEWHRTCEKSEKTPGNEDLCNFLCLAYSLQHTREPKMARTVINWFDNHYPPGHQRKEYFLYLENALETCIEERSGEWVSGTTGPSISQKKKKKKPGRS